VEVALILVALIYNEVDKPESLSPCWLPTSRTWMTALERQSSHKCRLARFRLRHFSRLSLCVCRSNRKSHNSHTQPLVACQRSGRRMIWPSANPLSA